MSEDELTKKTTALIDEYANIRDLKVKLVDVLVTIYSMHLMYARKNAQVVTDLQTSCKKDVVKPISGCVPSCCAKS